MGFTTYLMIIYVVLIIAAIIAWIKGKENKNGLPL